MTGFAVVTGGSSGIGRGLVLAFAAAGYRVAFSHFEAADAAGTVLAEVEAAGGAAVALSCDAGDGAAVEQFFDEACAFAGAAPDVLVNNAGIQTWAPLLELSEAAWNRVIRTNLTGTFLNTQAAARRMKDQGIAGAIVNIGSGCNKLAFPRLVDYTASKGGIEQFTKVAAVELGPDGIRVNCVAPGAVVTERTLAEAPDYEESWGRITPLRRAGTPDDIAAAVLFLASKQAGFITGQTIWVDGGLFSQPQWPYPV
ncbi:SDR family NAD(P)-dependent oxidoreductase [Rhizobium halophytocola]|uniref:NAD(P)-dependent dehydrogenase (Short-subunit alcohol dehydrogenase family) n=1 Tax=Rhizobium halophytocola TaxID=735519 RepID=A0ABS4DZD6_9HYPH|nr:SDR family NAD(P)-dependent oxidoreductase [Rhizobium halophytocola]MBP1851047.1 NAD(P)-dependent dehydrogenase (short-subunit alcohol dehydrogenase family) [Rhizobium halophytocola]